MAVYFLHGFGGSESDWDEVRDTLPGTPLRIDWLAASNLEGLIESLAEQVRPGIAHFIGYSMGGRLSILLALVLIRRGWSLDSLVLVSSGLGFSRPEEREERRAQDQAWANLARSSFSRFWQEWYAQGLFSTMRELPELQRARWMKSRNSLDSESLCKALALGSPANHEYLLDNLKILKERGVNVLYIAGELDKKYRNLAQNLASFGIPTEVIPGSGHALPLEKPRQLATLATEFIRKTKG